MAAERRNSLPLLKRARIEVYLPEAGSSAYARLERAFQTEFLETFGGCTVIKGARGLYLDSSGERDIDKISLIYTDTPFDFDGHFDEIAAYADQLRDALLTASEEESILIAVHAIYHSLP